jgi:hypothetical protein
MASMPSMPRPFAVSMGKSHIDDEVDAADSGSLIAPVSKDIGQSRRSTISIFSTPYTPTSKQEVSTPLLSPTPSKLLLQTSASPPLTTDADDLTPVDKVRSSSFMSHSQHHETLKAANRPRSDSAASNSSGSAMGLPASRGGVVGAFGAVTNLVSNVRHAYSPSVSSQTSNAGKAGGAPIQRFLECEVDDLKMCEVALLLADYKRLAARLSETT